MLLLPDLFAGFLEEPIEFFDHLFVRKFPDFRASFLD